MAFISFSGLKPNNENENAGMHDAKKISSKAILRLIVFPHEIL